MIDFTHSFVPIQLPSFHALLLNLQENISWIFHEEVMTTNNDYRERERQREIKTIENDISMLIFAITVCKTFWSEDVVLI